MGSDVLPGTTEMALRSAFEVALHARCGEETGNFVVAQILELAFWMGRCALLYRLPTLTQELCPRCL